MSAYLLIGDNLESKKVTCFVYFNSIICAVFLLLLGFGYYFQITDMLSILNLLKYPIIPMVCFSVYGSYKLKKIIFLYPIICALILLWFMGFDFAYRWDAIEHVARAKFFIENDFFGSSERLSFVYLIWGFVYRIVGESETVTHLTNMIIGLVGVFGIFFIAREIYDEFVGIISLIISLTLPVFFLVNKWAYLDMPFFSFIVFTFLFLIKYLKTKNEFFLILSLCFAFIATGTKEPGIIIFFVIGSMLFWNNCLSKRNILYLSTSIIFSIGYLIIMMLSLTKFSNFQEFSIVTPLTYGFDTIFLWAGALNQELCQILYTGLLFIAILAFLPQKSNKLLYYPVIFLEIVLLCGIASFPTTRIFDFPVIPFGNYSFYLLIFFIVIIVILSLWIRKKITFKFENCSLLLLCWIGIFLLFFMINIRITGYGIKNPFDASVLDFRYLLPAFPPVIILFSKGISNMLDFKDRKIKSLGLFILSLIIIINVIMSLNLAFIFASSGNIHLEGYESARNITRDGNIYTHWPFDYFPEGKSYDIGQYSWVTDNLSYKSIWTDTFTPGSAFLGSSHFFEASKIPNSNYTTIASKSLYLNPVLPDISEKTIDSVSFGIIPNF